MSTNTLTTATRAQSANPLTTAYQAIQPQANSLSVITDEPSVRARVNDLHARLAGLGITDVSQQGRLVLGASVVISQGLRTGVAMQAEPALSGTLDIDIIPSLLDYTWPIGRRGAMDPAPLASRWRGRCTIHGAPRGDGTSGQSAGRPGDPTASPGHALVERDRCRRGDHRRRASPAPGRHAAGGRRGHQVPHHHCPEPPSGPWRHGQLGGGGRVRARGGGSRLQGESPAVHHVGIVEAAQPERRQRSGWRGRRSGISRRRCAHGRDLGAPGDVAAGLRAAGRIRRDRAARRSGRRRR